MTEAVSLDPNLLSIIAITILTIGFILLSPKLLAWLQDPRTQDWLSPATDRGELGLLRFFAGLCLLLGEPPGFYTIPALTTSIGLFSRTSCALAALLYLGSVRQANELGLLVSLVLLILSIAPCGKAWSVDVLIAYVRGFCYSGRANWPLARLACASSAAAFGLTVGFGLDLVPRLFALYLCAALFVPFLRTFAFIISVATLSPTAVFAALTLQNFRPLWPYFSFREGQRPYLLLYDGNCEFCRRARMLVEALDVFCRIETANYHRQDCTRIAQKYSIIITPEDCQGQMQLCSTGIRLSGFDAIFRLFALLPLLWPIFVLFLVPGMRYLGRFLYKKMAAIRQQLIYGEPYEEDQTPLLLVRRRAFLTVIALTFFACAAGLLGQLFIIFI